MKEEIRTSLPWTMTESTGPDSGMSLGTPAAFKKVFSFLHRVLPATLVLPGSGPNP